MYLEREDGIPTIFGYSDTQPPAFLQLYPEAEPICLVATKKSYYLFKPLMLPVNMEVIRPGGMFSADQR